MFLQAAAVAHTLFCTCYEFNMQVKNATVLLLLAEIHKVHRLEQTSYLHKLKYDFESLR